MSLFAGPPRPARHATRPDDAEIARRALEVIRWVTTLPEGSVRIGVRDGWITLEGRVDALSMRVAAEEAVCKLEGIAGVRNLLDVRPVPGSQSAADHQRRLRDPLAHRDFRKVLPRGGARLRARRGASPEPS